MQHSHDRPVAADAAVVTQFALHVVSRLTRTNTIEHGAPLRDLLLMLVRFSRYGDPAIMARIFDDMRRHRISAEQVIDVYLPAAVRSLGESWHEGDLDILQTSIACARLQALLRELGKAWMADQTGSIAGPRVLLVLPRDEQHTLGAMIAANQLRRLGVSVRVDLLPTVQHVQAELTERRFDALFLSVSNLRSLESCRELVKTLRADWRRDIPVVIGGGIVASNQSVMTPERIASMTGAGLATANITDALNYCGLWTRSEAAE